MMRAFTCPVTGVCGAWENGTAGPVKSVFILQGGQNNMKMLSGAAGIDLNVSECGLRKG